MIYSEDINNITFELRNSGGNVIDDTTLNVFAGQQRIDLNFNIPIANDMQLGFANNALQTYGLYRNNSGANYPYDIASAINITSSSANTDPYGYYYFFYDIEVEVLCNDISSGINTLNSNKKLIKYIDVLGRTNNQSNTLLFYIYDDGTVEKRIIIE